MKAETRKKLSESMKKVWARRGHRPRFPQLPISRGSGNRPYVEIEPVKGRPNTKKPSPDSGSTEVAPVTFRNAIAIVKELVKSGKIWSDKDAIKYMVMCQAQKLNPFEDDVQQAPQADPFEGVRDYPDDEITRTVEVLRKVTEAKRLLRGLRQMLFEIIDFEITQK